MSNATDNFDWERPIPWEPGGYSPVVQEGRKKATGMFEWPAKTRCQYCGEALQKLHGLTPRGTSLGWLLRGKGPWCYWHNLEAWQAWQRGLYFGKTQLNGW